MRAETQKKPLRVLVLGGAGVFGSRVARLLASDPNIEVVIAGRNLKRAELAARAIEQTVPGARISARVFDRDTQMHEDLRTAAIDLVVHAAGPFQNQDYDVARAALAAGAHYVDLADDRGFVERFDRINRNARAANRVAITGLSSIPAISSSVVTALAEDLSHVAEIRIGISPGNRTPRGRAVVQGILSTVGQAGEQRKGGAWIMVFGWQDIHRRTLKVTGRKTLKRWFSHCEVPDPDLLLARFPTAETITFHAGLELPILHLGLWLLSWPVRWRLVGNLGRFTPILEFIANLLRPLGSDQGGMFVEVTGRDAQRKWVRRSWTLHAGKGDGPMVPAIPAAIVARAMAAGHMPPPGARSAVALLTLKSIEDAFAPFDIKTERTETPLNTPLFVKVLGEKFAEMPAPLRDLHTGLATLRFEGESNVQRGSNLVTRLIARLVGFPSSAESVPVTVMIEPTEGGERWTRTFGTYSFFSHYGIRERKGEKLITEQFGPFRFEMAVETDDKHLALKLKRTRWFGLPWPGILSPRIKAEERVENGRFVFDVRVAFPLLGLLVHYVGWLVPSSVSLRPQAQRRPEFSATHDSRSPTWPY